MYYKENSTGAEKQSPDKFAEMAGRFLTEKERDRGLGAIECAAHE